MEFKCKLWGLFLILSLAQVSRAQLQCYVCENCAEVSGSTPLLECDDDFFNPGGNTEPSTQTTTNMPTGTTEKTTEMPSTSSNTNAPSTTETSSSTTYSTTTLRSTESTTTSNTAVPTETTTSPITTTEGTTSDSTTASTNTSSPSSNTTMTSTTKDTTTEQSTVTTDSTTHMDTTTNAVTDGSEITTNATESTSSTELYPPTPSTAHPPSSIPTPPNPDSETPIDDSAKYSINGTDSDHAGTKPYIASSQFRVRQARSVSDYTYHCFKVVANVNGSMITNRGCSRVKTMESVCGQWKQQHPTDVLNKCHPCSNTRCNGSTALNLSLGALALALVAAVLQRK